MFRNMVTSLLSHERIVTTEVKAKEIGRLAEKMITLGKRGDLHARRQTVAFIRSNEVVKKLFTVYPDRYADRQGGYTRILKLEPRPGDNAPMAILELVDRPIAEPKPQSPKTKEKAKAPTARAAEKKSAEKKSEKKTAAKAEKEEKAESPKKKTPAKKETEAKKETKAKKGSKVKAEAKDKTGAQKTTAAKKETPAREKKE